MGVNRIGMVVTEQVIADASRELAEQRRAFERYMSRAVALLVAVAEAPNVEQARISARVGADLEYDETLDCQAFGPLLERLGGEEEPW